MMKVTLGRDHDLHRLIGRSIIGGIIPGAAGSCRPGHSPFAAGLGGPRMFLLEGPSCIPSVQRPLPGPQPRGPCWGVERPAGRAAENAPPLALEVGIEPRHRTRSRLYGCQAELRPRGPQSRPASITVFLTADLPFSSSCLVSSIFVAAFAVSIQINRWRVFVSGKYSRARRRAGPYASASAGRPR